MICEMLIFGISVIDGCVSDFSSATLSPAALFCCHQDTAPRVTD